MVDQYVIFGGTRWGGSFWHHNLEMKNIRQDMSRRVSRFYGRENVPAATPRFFVRAVNSTREVNAILRFRNALRSALPGEPDLYLLLIVDLQLEEKAMGVEGEDGLLVYGIAETETLHNLNSGADGFRKCSETYSRAIAFAAKHWSGTDAGAEVQTFKTLNHLAAACVQFDGGDTGRELFTPRKFYGQQMAAVTEASKLQNLLAKLQTQMFLVPAESTEVLSLECFGMCLKALLPPGTKAGDVLYLFLNDGKLSGNVSSVVQGDTGPQASPVGPATVVEQILPSAEEILPSAES
jgi:hypothetical protein